MKTGFFIIIGNYPKDGQESMERFAQMLAMGLNEEGYKTVIWRPVCFFGRYASSTISGFGKWIGYIDKWLLFPLILIFRLANGKFHSQNIRFHICDHSNAPYLRHLPSNRTGITCHDVLAIRGALGYADSYCPASPFGKLLQQWILKNLGKAKRLAAVSQFTLDQLMALTKENKSGGKQWRVVHNGFNAEFKPLEAEETKKRLSQAGLEPEEDFILHVGSDLPRKNRRLLIDMVAVLGNKWHGKIYFAGKAIDEALLDHAKSLRLEDRIVSIVKPSHKTLEALYNACDAFIFPSFSEGFGWPLIEAQACGAPVIASNYQPMPEVSGGAALHADPTKPEAFAVAFLSLQNQLKRESLIQLGYENVQRFRTSVMIEQYLQLYGLPTAKKKETCSSNF